MSPSCNNNDLKLNFWKIKDTSRRPENLLKKDQGGRRIVFNLTSCSRGKNTFSLYIHSMYSEMKIISLPPPPPSHTRWIYRGVSLRVSIYVGQTRDYLNGFHPFGRYNFFNILTRIGRERRPAKRPPTEGWQTSTSSPQNSFIRERRGTSDLEETAPFRMHNTF